MAAMDSRLLDVVRLMRQGKYEYGRDNGYAHILGSYCAEIGLDPSLGDPANGQLPCLVVHGNMTKSCEFHTVIRWITGFLMALKVARRVKVFNCVCARSISSLIRALFFIL